MLETATGVFLYTISARYVRFLSVQNVLNIFATVWSDIWKIPSLLDDEAIAMAIAESFECISVSEICLSPNTTCRELSTPLAKQFESNLCRNLELLTIESPVAIQGSNMSETSGGQSTDKIAESLPVASSEVDAFQWSSVSESFESNPPPDIRYKQSLASVDQLSEIGLSTNANDQYSHSKLSIYIEDQHAQSELNINTEDQHSQSELRINTEQLPILSSKAVVSECFKVCDPPESNPSPDDTHENNSPLVATCEKPTMPFDQHLDFEVSFNAEYQCSESKLSVNGDRHSELELNINAESFQFASSKVVGSEFLSLFGTPGPSEPEYNKNEESIARASELRTYESVPKTPDNKEQPQTMYNSDDYLTTGDSALSPSARVFETLDNIPSPESTYNIPSETPPAYHLMSPMSQNTDSLLMTELSPTPSARVYSTQSPEQTCNLPFTSSCLFARCFQTPDRNQTPETARSISLIPPAYHSEYRRFTETCSSPESTCSPHLNALQFQSQFSINAETTLFTVTFNQNFTCFACGTDQGIRVYKCDPFEEVYNGYFGHGGIGIVEMHYESKILVFVGSEDNIQCPPDKVIIWDYEFHRCIYQLTTDSKVQAVKITRDHMVVVLEQETCVYNCVEIEAELLYRIKTQPNTKGLSAVSDMSSSPVLACPGLLKGQVRIEHLVPRKTRFVSAHDSHIACLALSKYGAILATASTKGTLLRIFNTSDGTCLQEVRRGAKRAEIYSIGISEIVQLLAMCSDKGTVHIVGLNEKVAKQEQVARKESNNIKGNAWRRWNVCSGETSLVLQGANSSFPFSFMKGVVPKYFNSDRSFSQFHFSPNVRSLVGFGKHNIILIVGYDGSFYRCEFDPVHGGEMMQKLYKRFF